MSIWPDKEKGGWAVDCIFCGDWAEHLSSYDTAMAAHRSHLLRCPDLTADDRRAAFSGRDEE